MGGRDLTNPWGNEIPPVLVIDKVEPRQLTAAESSHFDTIIAQLEALEEPFVVDGKLVEPGDDEGDGFLRRMTGF